MVRSFGSNEICLGAKEKVAKEKVPRTREKFRLFFFVRNSTIWTLHTGRKRKRKRDFADICKACKGIVDK